MHSQIYLIIVDGEMYDLSDWSDITGISEEDIIKSIPESKKYYPESDQDY